MALKFSELGRRERQIMDILVRRGRASAAEVLSDLPDKPTYSAVRGMLKLLSDKGHVRYEWDGPRYVYLPTGDTRQMQHAAVRHLLTTFFNKSPESAVVAMLGAAEKSLSDEELARLEQLVVDARRKRGQS